MSNPLGIFRHFTKPGFDPLKDIEWRHDVTVTIGGSGGSSPIYHRSGLSFPVSWDQPACDIFAHKFFYKGELPSCTNPHDTSTERVFIPERYRPRVAIPSTGPSPIGESSARQVFHRLAGHWAYAALTFGYADAATADVLYDELYYMLATQRFAPNSPQFFNTGIWWAYGITGKDGSGGYFAPEIGTRAVSKALHPYARPQTSACFILGLEDNLLDDNGIMETLAREAHIFKYGSGSGINYSKLRAKGTPLNNGGKSSGLMSFLNVFDSNAGVIKSGGTTRRAARMVVVDCDHPEAEDFVTWKHREELKVKALTAGAKALKAEIDGTPTGDDTDSFISDFLGTIDDGYEGEAYQTVSGQNANNSLRVTNAFMQCVNASIDDPRDTSGEKRLWAKLVRSAHACGDPGVQFHDIINRWHTIPNVAPQRSTNPCGEFSFIDNSSCNLASLNLIKFYDFDNKCFLSPDFTHAVHLVTILLDLTISLSGYPTEAVARNSTDYRPLGLGYGNLGGLLMALGYPYDSATARAIAATITSAMQAQAIQTSSLLADHLGAFRDFDQHKHDVHRVFEMHAHAANAIGPVPSGFHALKTTAEGDWESIITVRAPVRNAQLSLLAPTGTIGLALGFATTGIEPEFSLVKLKKLAGGGTMTIASPIIKQALKSLDYSESEIENITAYITVHGRCPHNLPSEHQRVFACANDITPGGHLMMMAAVQPFLSGGISKTVNLPANATVAEVDLVMRRAYDLGLKSITIYRDGCKTQPLTKVTSTAEEVNVKVNVRVKAKGATPEPVGVSLVAASPPTTHDHGPERHHLPARRRGITQKVTIAGHSLYVRTGEYDNGRLGEIFLTISKEGSTLKHLLDSLAVTISLGLQYGVPLDEYVDAFKDTRSDPNGLVQGSANVKFCSSLMDYLVKELAATYSAHHADNNNNAHGEEPHPKPVLRVMASGAPISRPNYTGDMCPNCQSMTMARNGSCLVCHSCGSTTGCS